MSGIRLFYFLLFGQSLSVLGSALTNFALGVWAYKAGGNVSDFTMIAIASTLPGILLGPFIGSLIDRLDRKWVLFFAQLGSATVILILATLYWADALQVWQIIMLVPVASLCGAVLQIGFSAVVGTLVPPNRLGRANGMLGLVFGVVQLGSPLLAGIALDQLGLEGIFAIDLVSYAIGLSSLLVVSLPSVARKEAMKSIIPA